MSKRIENRLSLAGNARSLTLEGDLEGTFERELSMGMHGLCFSPYVAKQSPGSPINVEQICARLNIVKRHTSWIRTFSCTQGNEVIPGLAKEMGLKTLVGAWLGEDKAKNEREISNLIKIVEAGNADLAAVGNEVMYRGDMEESELLSYIERVRKALPDATIGYVDAYYEFVDRPAIAAACDVILANCYPFWEGCDIDYSLVYMKGMYEQALRAGQGKKVIITETGWPSSGTTEGSAAPSEVNAMRYFIDAMQWSREEGIELFYFSSFDEDWKVGAEGDVGAYWGIWDTHGDLKYQR